MQPREQHLCHRAKPIKIHVTPVRHQRSTVRRLLRRTNLTQTHDNCTDLMPEPKQCTHGRENGRCRSCSRNFRWPGFRAPRCKLQTGGRTRLRIVKSTSSQEAHGCLLSDYALLPRKLGAAPGNALRKLCVPRPSMFLIYAAKSTPAGSPR